MDKGREACLADLETKFVQIAHRKVSVLDEYGDECRAALPKEIRACLAKVAARDGVLESDFRAWWRSRGHLPGSSFLSGWKPHLRHLGEAAHIKAFTDWWKTRTLADVDWLLCRARMHPDDWRSELCFLERRLELLFDEYHRAHAGQSHQSADLDRMSWREFEALAAPQFLRAQGVTDVRGTPTVGDQGADYLGRKDGRLVVVQVKKSEANIGNKAVQEVLGAMQFYAADEAWVLTDSSFTPSARALAQKAGVRLIDGQEMARLGREPRGQP